MLKNKYLSILFCVSSGQNGENLGSDELEVIHICNLIIDVDKRKTIGPINYSIRPRKIDKFGYFLTEDCKLLTGLTEAMFDLATSLENAIDDFDNYLIKNNIHPTECENSDLVFVTDGPLHLRQLLLPECFRKDKKLPSYYYNYYDIRKECAKRYGSNEKLNSIDDVLKCMNIESTTETCNFSNKNIKNLEKIVLQLLENGHTFKAAEQIQTDVIPGICLLAENIEENTVVKVRGLPWQCTDQDICNFFIGLNIADGGVALCLSSQGRRNGEALVRFVNEEHRNFALRRHKHHIGQRYIEVYRASGKDFFNVAGGSNGEAKAFLSRNGKVIIRMRGLPFDSGAKEVIEFFERGDNKCEVVDGEQGVLFVHYPDGRATGDAFVMMKSDEEAARALLKHKELIGTRYIELFKSTTAEVQQVLKRSQDPKFFQNASSIHSSSSSSSSNSGLLDATLTPLPILPPELITGGNKRDCIRLRMLPYDCGVEQILEFLGTHSQHIVQQGVHMIYNSQGHPSGEAFIQMDSEHASTNVATHKNNKCMFFNNKKYFIDVLQCSGEEMNLVLMGILPSNLINGCKSASSVSLVPPSLPAPSSLALPPPPLTAFTGLQPSQIAQLSSSSVQKQIITNSTNQYLVGLNQMPNGQNFALNPSKLNNSPAQVNSTVYYSNISTVQNQPGLLPSSIGPNSTAQLRQLGPLASNQVQYQPSQMINNSLISNPQLIASGPNSYPLYPPLAYYWYPTPPVSPSSTVFLHHSQSQALMHAPASHLHSSPPAVNSCLIIIKGAPLNTTVNDVLRFLQGYGEILPECVHIQPSQDSYTNGLSSVDVYVTMFNRIEAERAIVEKNHQKIGNNTVELFATVAVL